MKKIKLLGKKYKRLINNSEELTNITTKDLFSYTCLINRIMKKMLCRCYFFFFFIFCLNSNAQIDTTSFKTHTQIFSLSPISKNVDMVNGLVFGVGHFDNQRIKNQTINGLNVEINAAPIAGAFMGFMSIMYLPEIIKNNKKPNSIKQTGEFIKIEKWNSNLKLKVNGINLSTGCFFTSTSLNGLNISFGNKFENFNGLSISVLGTIADTQNGISIGLYNGNNNLKGITIGLMNSSYVFKGSQIGIINYSKENKGIQIGIFNRSFSKGLQVGIWNVNNKRSMPFINW